MSGCISNKNERRARLLPLLTSEWLTVWGASAPGGPVAAPVQ
jgi:hypothetical protein